MPPSRPVSGASPKVRAAAAAARWGQPEFARACAALLGGGVDDALVDALGGPAAPSTRGPHRADQRYWHRVWAARGLLWEWDPAALGALRAAARDEQWRVREMVCKVAARHALEGALDEVAALRADPVARVRAAAERAFVAVVARG